MQPFIPARLRKALTFLRPRVPGGPVDDPVDLPAARAGLEDSARRFADPVFGLGGRALERNLALYLNSPEERFHPLVSPALADLRGLPRTCLFAAALDPLFDDSFSLASAMRSQGGECYLIEMPGTAHGGVPFGYAPACRALMVQTALDLLNADAPRPITGGAA